MTLFFWNSPIRIVFYCTACCLLFIFCFSSCYWNQQKGNSIIVIAVDQLGVNDISCFQESNPLTPSGIKDLCQDSIRYTHCFTSSTLSVPAMSSLLTGLYPHMNEVRDNGSYLKSAYQTISKMAYKKGYKTAFFSGGPPLLRKTGFQQGFETFDDNHPLKLNKLYRSFDKSVENFLDWVDENSKFPFLSVFYVPDLKFKYDNIEDKMGDFRTISSETQFAHFDESLASLISKLKQKNLWDSTYIILVGLNGHIQNDNPDLPQSLNLHSENTQVTLLIKPPHKHRDEGVFWTEDKLVSIVDVGTTIMNILESPSFTFQPNLTAISLMDSLKAPGQLKENDRIIITESAWGYWKNLSHYYASIRQKNLLYFHEKKSKIFNTLIDRAESFSIPFHDSSLKSFGTTAQQLSDILGFLPFEKTLKIKKLNLMANYDLWKKLNEKENRLALLKNLSHGYQEENEFTTAYAEELIKQKKWDLLKDLGHQITQLDWIVLAKKNLYPNLNMFNFEHPCLKLIDKKIFSGPLLKSCDDPYILSLLWFIKDPIIDLKNTVNNEALKKKIFLTFDSYFLKRKILDENRALGFIWDTPDSNYKTLALFAIALEIPHLQKEKNHILKHLSSIKEID